jgi:hypothetical protein
VASELLCLFCKRQAFAIVDVELDSGRGRWPVCAAEACINRAFVDAHDRLMIDAQRARARARDAVPAAHPEAIDADAVEDHPALDG